MALSNNTTTATAGASAFLARLFAARSSVSHTDNNYETEITDWEFVNNSDFSDDNDDDGKIIEILSDSDSDNASTLISVSVVDNHGLEIDDHDYGSLAVVGIRSTYGAVTEEKKKASEQQQHQQQDLDEEIVDPESESDEDNDDDLDDELVPWSVSDRFGRQRMRKLGTRAYSKMNKTTKKFAYTVNRPGCVRGKHGLGRKA